MEGERLSRGRVIPLEYDAATAGPPTQTVPVLLGSACTVNHTAFVLASIRASGEPAVVAVFFPEARIA